MQSNKNHDDVIVNIESVNYEINPNQYEVKADLEMQTDDDNFSDSLYKQDTFSSRVKEFGSSPDSKSSSPKYPILFVDINLGNNKIERITVYEGMRVCLTL